LGSPRKKKGVSLGKKKKSPKGKLANRIRFGWGRKKKNPHSGNDLAVLQNQIAKKKNRGRILNISIKGEKARDRQKKKPMFLSANEEKKDPFGQVQVAGREIWSRGIDPKTKIVRGKLG